MRIRRYKKSDESRVKKLIFSVLTHIYGKTKLEWENFEDYLVIYVAEQEGKIIGVVAIKKINDKIIKLKRMYVRIKSQNKGIGKKLIGRVIEFSIKQGFKKMILTTYPEMENAVKFYKKQGFKIVKNPPLYFFTNPKLKEYNKRQIAMEKKLK